MFTDDNAAGMTRRSALAAFAGTAFGAMLAGYPALAREIRKFRLLMAPEQSGVYHAYAILQSRAEDHHPWLRPINVETGGFNYNVTYIGRNPDQWKDTMFGSATVLEWAAKKGVKPFYNEPMAAAEDFQIIGGMGSTGNFWVTFDPAIRTPNDFVGKNVSIGLLTQNEWGMYPRMLLDGWGLTKKLKSLNPLGPLKNIEALLDGKVEVAFMVSFFAPDMKEIITAAPFNQLLASNRKFYYVDVPTEMIEGYNKMIGANFNIRRFRPGALPNQPTPFTTLGDEMTVSAHKSFPEDLAYEFTKLWVKMGPIVAKYNALGKVWTPEGIAGPAKAEPQRTHPGALRAFRELGLLT